MTRDEEGMGHKTFAVLADHLARRGVAVLRYDKRGVAASTGDYDGHTQADLVADLAAVVRQMRARPGFGKLGLIGHSEGPHLAAEVAARDPKSVDFLVSLAGVGLNGFDALRLQDKAGMAGRGAAGEELARLEAYFAAWYGIIVAEPDADVRIARLKALQAALPQADRDLIKKYGANTDTLSLDWAAKPFVRADLLSDAPAWWARVRAPVLALNGDLDRQVPPENLAGIAAALKAGGNRRVETVLLPRLNHLMQTAPTGAEEEYAVIDETLAPVVLERVTTFVKRQR